MRADGAAFALVLLAAVCAENIPLMLVLTVAAGVCIIVKGVCTMTYKTCPDCGANLDPGEVCDCQKTADLRRRCHDMVDQLTDPALIEWAKRFLTYLYVYRETDEKDRPGATNTEAARADKIVTKTI